MRKFDYLCGKGRLGVHFRRVAGLNLVRLKVVTILIGLTRRNLRILALWLNLLLMATACCSMC